MKINNSLNIISFVLVAAVIIISGLMVDFSEAAVFNQPSTEFRAGQFLVKFKGDDEVYRFNVSNDTDIFSVIKKYENRSEIEYIEPNYIFKATAFPNDPDYNLQWYLGPISARDSWSKELLFREQHAIGKNAVIAVLDTGVQINHPDLKDKIWINVKEVANDGIDNDKNGYIDDVVGWNFVDDDNQVNPSFGLDFSNDAIRHGTMVAGIAAATSNNLEGIVGVSWFARIMPLRVLDDSGSGDVYSVVLAVKYAIANGADVINMSFVGDNYSQALNEAIAEAHRNDIMIVAAAGNTDPSIRGIDSDVTKYYPACYDGLPTENMVIGVASVGKDLKKSSFSNYGGCVDLTAPGENFFSTQPADSNLAGFSKYYAGYWSGTSLSTPIVSGLIATIRSLRPDLRAVEIKKIVFSGVKDISAYNSEYKGKLGIGLVNAAKSIDNAIGQKMSINPRGKSSYIVAGLGLGSFPQIKVFSSDGTVFKSFYAYSPNFKGLINVAACDLKGDGNTEIVTAAGSNGSAHVRVFDIDGHLISEFFAYDKSYQGGINVACGDVNGDGHDEIITGVARGLPEVKIFDYKGGLLAKFLAYDQKFTGGIKVAAGNVKKDNIDEIITGPQSSGGPHIKVFDQTGSLISEFFAFNQNYKGGMNIATGDTRGSGLDEIVVALGGKAMPEVRVYNYNGGLVGDFFAFDPTFLSGVNVACGDMDNNGTAEIIAGTGVGQKPEIRIFNLFGQQKFDLLIHDQKNYFGGARLATMKY